MRLLLLVILLAFPVADLYVTTRVARWTGIPLWLLLAGSLVAGFVLLRNERYAFRTRTVAALHGEQSLLRGVLDSGRKVLAAFLLMLPGLVSDLIALTLLALPLNVGSAFGHQPAAVGRWPRATRDFDTIDGEAHRLD
ncbi:MAG: FxsA family protein [Burkholderiales bacterium]|nr:FxsA family protein [Burkholderiales bacterium]